MTKSRELSFKTPPLLSTWLFEPTVTGVFGITGSPEYGEAIPLNIQTNYMRFDVADWDNDGDLDVIVGHRTVILYKNQGSRTAPQFSQTVKSSISMFGSR